MGWPENGKRDGRGSVSRLIFIKGICRGHLDEEMLVRHASLLA